jgi:hypothetical protein
LTKILIAAEILLPIQFGQIKCFKKYKADVKPKRKNDSSNCGKTLMSKEVHQKISD